MSTDMLHLKQSLCDVESYYSISYIFVIFTGPLLSCRAKFLLSAFAKYVHQIVFPRFRVRNPRHPSLWLSIISYIFCHSV
jgi:hypothetical protein